MKKLFTSFDDFCRNFKGLDDKPERLEALKSYFTRGGVISAENKGKGWPKLVYPSVQRIKEQAADLKQRKAIYDKQNSGWKKSHNSAKNYDLRNEVMKFSDPLYWKHIVKYHSDKAYKNDSDSVKLPVHLVSDERWKPMIRMFIEDGEYRNNLVETVSHSIVYQKDKKLAKYSEELKEFRMEMTGKAISGIDKKLEVLEKDIKSFDEILKWASEK